MEEHLELKIVCKLCNKKFPSGKSLGGHMRSHAIANSADLGENEEHNKNKRPSWNHNNTGKVLELGGQSGYGLRENPKKTWRFVDSTFPVPLEVCNQCGKGFQSLKALCGHMACHSEKDRFLKDDHSWTNQKLVMDNHSDTEAEDLKQQHGFKSQMYKRTVTKASSFSFANGSSSVSGVDEQEEEDVAMCLMMLSRDSGSRGGVNSVVESSDNNSVVLETKSSAIDMRMSIKEGLNHVNNDGTLEMKKLGSGMLKSIVLDTKIAELENSDSGYFLNGAQKGESVDGFLGNGQYRKCKGTGYARLHELDSESRRDLDKPKSYEIEEGSDFKKEDKYDYVGISTKSQPRKRKDGFYDSQLGEESCKKVASGLSRADECKGTNKRSKYECLSCKRIFKSYQALGGHRPCHKKIGDCSAPKYEDDQNRIGDDIARDKVGSSKFEDSLANKKTAPKEEKRIRFRTQKNKGHKCPICYRTFKSGQALGGHKRSHFVGGPEENNNQTPQVKQEVPNLLDLNLPAPEMEEEDEDTEFI